MSLATHDGITWPPTQRTVVDTIGVLSVYSAIVLLFALLVPPHRLPYSGFELRKAMPMAKAAAMSR